MALAAGVTCGYTLAATCRARKARACSALQLIGGACAGGGSVWTYTHRWVDIDRDAWGSSISVLASVENIEFAHHARKLGYAPALVVDKFASDKAHTLREGKRSLKVIPCPAQTRGTTCVECRLCLDRDLHTMNVAIGFSVHGVEAAKARRRLPVLKAMAA